MGFLSNLVGAAFDPAKTIDAVGKAADGLFTSDDERNAFKLKLEELRQKPGELQVELNKIEAGHRTLFVAGWRPAVGWVCAFALAYHYILRDMMLWGMQVAAVVLDAQTAIPGPPKLDLGDLITLLLALLGLGTMRSWEKDKGVSK